MNNTSCTYYAELNGKLFTSENFPAVNVDLFEGPAYIDINDEKFQPFIEGAAIYKTVTKEVISK